MNHIFKRTITGLAVGALVVLIFIYCPLQAVLPLVLALSSLVQLEFYQLAGRYEPFRWLGLGAGALWLTTVGLFGFGRGLIAVSIALPVAAVALTVAVCIASLCSARRKAPIASAAVTLAGFFYIPFMMSFFLLTAQATGDGFWGMAGGSWLDTPRWTRTGLYTLMALVATAKFSDTGGFALGMAFGRHKMCPSISPNKSWEGMLGSVLFAAATMCVFLAIARRFGWDGPWPRFSYAGAAAVGAALSVVATLGDLVESRFKREVGVKDSATFMPAGMGGFLDMFDSVLFVPAVVFPFLAWVVL